MWCPGLDSDIENLARACISCQSVKQAPSAAPLRPCSWPTKPWQRVHIDFAGPFLDRMYLLVVNAHSKWPEVFELTQMTILPRRLLSYDTFLQSMAYWNRLYQTTDHSLSPRNLKNLLRVMASSIHTRCSPYHLSSKLMEL